MTCRELVDFLMAYLDGELPAAQREAFERHLSVCPSCVNYMATYKEAVRLGRQAMVHTDAPVPSTVPDALVQAVLAAARRR